MEQSGETNTEKSDEREEEVTATGAYVAQLREYTEERIGEIDAQIHERQGVVARRGYGVFTAAQLSQEAADVVVNLRRLVQVRPLIVARAVATHKRFRQVTDSSILDALISRFYTDVTDLIGLHVDLVARDLREWNRTGAMEPVQCYLSLLLPPPSLTALEQEAQ